MQGFLYTVAALLYLSSVYLVVKGQDDICRDIVCPRGRMCVARVDNSGNGRTTCECPTNCPGEASEPVCNYYNRTFNSRCEMHKYGCAHDLTMKVKNEGSCPSDVEVLCSDEHLLQFASRYLEWIMIAHETSLDSSYELDLAARADSLTEEERNGILEWEFEYSDKNNNDVIDKDEMNRIMADLSDGEPCIQGFLLSCDQNGKEGIEKHEWDSCFPKTAGTAFET